MMGGHSMPRATATGFVQPTVRAVSRNSSSAFSGSACSLVRNLISASAGTRVMVSSAESMTIRLMYFGPLPA